MFNQDLKAISCRFLLINYSLAKRKNRVIQFKGNKLTMKPLLLQWQSKPLKLFNNNKIKRRRKYQKKKMRRLIKTRIWNWSKAETQMKHQFKNQKTSNNLVIKAKILRINWKRIKTKLLNLITIRKLRILKSHNQKIVFKFQSGRNIKIY